MDNWVSLHTHTQYSILDGASKIPELVQRAKSLGMTALGISDHGNLFGAYEFWRECNRVGIKPIIGMEAYVAPESHLTKTPIFWGAPDQRKDDISGPGAYTHMLLIAMDATGLRNLYKLHELSYTEGFYRKPRVSLGTLTELNEGLIATTGCAGGAIPTMIRLAGGILSRGGALSSRLGAYLSRLGDLFPGRLYVEVMDHGRAEDRELNTALYELAASRGLPLLATNDSHYTNSGDAEVHDALLCIQTRAKLTDEDRFKFDGDGYHLKSLDEMKLTALPQIALENTNQIAERIESYDEVFEHKDRMPVSTNNLRQQVQGWLMSESAPSEYNERAMYEIEIIEQLGFSDYFLILADLIHWAKSQGILVGPGRGSAGGSLVAYALGITEIDPLRYGLLFERFLNPARISPPDIDVDIDPERRDEIFRYATEKYGQDKVAQLITFGTIKAKAALKDANRVLGGSYAEGAELTGMLPPDLFGRSAPLEDSPGIRGANPEAYDLALGLEGLVRNTSHHAGGLVISSETLSNFMPVAKAVGADLPTAAFEQVICENLGLLKYDILALDALTVIGEVLDSL